MRETVQIMLLVRTVTTLDSALPAEPALPAQAGPGVSAPAQGGPGV